MIGRGAGRRVAGLAAALWAGGAEPAARAAPVISEFLAVNTAGRADVDGSFSDWIEIHNPDTVAVELGGWYLTDSASNRRRWTLPATRLPPGGYLLVFASNKDRRDPAGELHTNFALAAEGEYLALVRPDGVTVEWEYAPTYPPQTADVSYGVTIAGGGVTGRGYFATPTPGAPNATTADATLASPVRFSPGAGTWAAPFRLEISGAGPGQHLRYTTVPAGPDGPARREPAPDSPRYSGPIEPDDSVLVRAAVFSDDLRSRGLARSALYLRREEAGPLGVGNWSTRLPVLVLALHGTEVPSRADGEKPAWLLAHPGGPAVGVPWSRPPEVAAPIRLAVRGSSSADFPKKSYNFDFVNDEGRSTAVALPGLPAFDEWALVGPWRYDPAYLRNAFIYALSNRLGRWAPRTQFVEVFVVSGSPPLDLAAYQGVYLLTDKLDLHPERIAIDRVAEDAAREPAISGGYLLKIGEPEAGEYHWATERGLDLDTISEVAVASPKLDRLSLAQRDYIRGYVQRLEDALHAGRDSGWSDRHYLDYLDRASWVDHHLLNTFAANPDAFERSAYFHKPRGGRVVAGPIWDFDRALGSPADPRSQRWDVWYGEDAVQPWHFGWWGILATDPEFQQEWIDRWQSLRRDVLSEAGLAALVEQLAAQLGGEAAARDAQRWPGEAGDGFAGEVRRLRDWVVARAAWIDRQFVAPPVVRRNGDTLVVEPAPGTRLAYTLDGSDPRALGGEPAANARFATAPLTVPAAANVQARAWRPDAVVSFPGSPWSGVAGGPGSTPIRPASRLVNLSSRAVVGRGEEALIAGVTVADTRGKRYLARGVGPALAAFGAAEPVPDPELILFTDRGVELRRNQGWGAAPEAAEIPGLARAAGAFPLPPGSADAAMVPLLPPGPYTLQVGTPTGRAGLGLVEVYEADTFGRTTNLSARAWVGAGDRALIGGFVVAGVAAKRMLLRAVGPTLAGFGVQGVLADPVLTVHAGADPVATNDQWAAGGAGPTVAAASRSVGAFALREGSEDAALILTVKPGAYTVELRGKSGGEGVALLEIYELP